MDESGRKKNQGTFVGFFPAEAPRYSVIAVVYSKLSHHSFYGGSYPAKAVKRLVNGIVNMDPYWQDGLKRSAQVPRMTPSVPAPGVSASGRTTVPDMAGLGLQDAIWLAENSGLRCSYTGTGHVRRQHPAAGTAVDTGTTLKIELQ